MLQRTKQLALVFCCCLGVMHSPSWAASQPELPSLGLASNLEITLAQEKILGQAWLRQFRAQANINTDALIVDFSERHLQKLATWNKELEDKNLDVIVLNQRELNAFAVPGGVVGLHTGLFLHAANEDEFASVAAHELAHITQRHFARRVQAAKGDQWKSLAGLLAGILAASQGHADAGIAAIISGQALGVHSQLAWSRSYEQEADRLGMETLVKAGYAPQAMPAMFETMQKLTSLSGRPPEFLLTHPLTQSRVSDAQARADQLASDKKRIAGEDYQMLRVRIAFQTYKQAQEALELFNKSTPSAQKYAQALYARSQEDLTTYLKLVQELHQENPSWLLANYLYIEALAVNKLWPQALQNLETLLELAPSYYPAQQLAIDFNFQRQEWDKARSRLQKLSQTRAKDPYIWYQLAEVAGKTGHISQVHQARAEYFQLTGRFSSAFEQLNLAIKRAENQGQPWSTLAALRERRKELENLRQQMESL